MRGEERRGENRNESRVLVIRAERDPRPGHRLKPLSTAVCSAFYIQILPQWNKAIRSTGSCLGERNHSSRGLRPRTMQIAICV